MSQHRFQVRVTYVMSKTYSVLAANEEQAVDVAVARTPYALRDAEADVSEVSATRRLPG